MKKSLSSLLIIGIYLLFSSCNSEKSKDLSEQKSLMNIADNPVAKKEREIIASQKRITGVNSKVHYGIDISHYQGNVLEEIPVGDSLRFLICKATEGITYVDPEFHTNWQEIKAKGFIRGAYHFYVCADDPLKQAAHFAATINNIESTDIAPILDIEQGSMSEDVSTEQMQKDILLFLHRVEALVKRKPIIYTGYDFANENLKNPIFSEYNLWLAEYTSAPKPNIPKLWTDKGILIWQRSESYHVASKTTDFDIAYGPIQDLIQ